MHPPLVGRNSRGSQQRRANERAGTTTERVRQEARRAGGSPSCRMTLSSYRCHWAWGRDKRLHALPFWSDEDFAGVG